LVHLVVVVGTVVVVVVGTVVVVYVVVVAVDSHEVAVAATIFAVHQNRTGAKDNLLLLLQGRCGVVAEVAGSAGAKRILELHRAVVVRREMSPPLLLLLLPRLLIPSVLPMQQPLVR